MDVRILPTGPANLASIKAALHRLGARAELVDKPQQIHTSRVLVLPGVGAFGPALAMLQARGLLAPLRERVVARRPTLAIALGLHLLTEGSDEAPDASGLGVVEGRVRRFPDGVRAPHMGWNSVTQAGKGLITSGHAWYAHSYRLTTVPPGWRVCWSSHGPLGDPSSRFVAALERGGQMATQFHPELSGRWGEMLIDRWLRLVLGGTLSMEPDTDTIGFGALLPRVIPCLDIVDGRVRHGFRCRRPPRRDRPRGARAHVRRPRCRRDRSPRRGSDAPAERGPGTHDPGRPGGDVDPGHGGRLDRTHGRRRARHGRRRRQGRGRRACDGSRRGSRRAVRSRVHRARHRCPEEGWALGGRLPRRAPGRAARCDRMGDTTRRLEAREKILLTTVDANGARAAYDLESRCAPFARRSASPWSRPDSLRIRTTWSPRWRPGPMPCSSSHRPKRTSASAPSRRRWSDTGSRCADDGAPPARLRGRRRVGASVWRPGPRGERVRGFLERSHRQFATSSMADSPRPGTRASTTTTTCSSTRASRTACSRLPGILRRRRRAGPRTVRPLGSAPAPGSPSAMRAAVKPSSSSRAATRSSNRSSACSPSTIATWCVRGRARTCRPTRRSPSTSSTRRPACCRRARSRSRHGPTGGRTRSAPRGPRARSTWRPLIRGVDGAAWFDDIHLELASTAPVTFDLSASTHAFEGFGVQVSPYAIDATFLAQTMTALDLRYVRIDVVSETPTDDDLLATRAATGKAPWLLTAANPPAELTDGSGTLTDVDGFAQYWASRVQAIEALGIEPEAIEPLGDSTFVDDDSYAALVDATRTALDAALLGDVAIVAPGTATLLARHEARDRLLALGVDAPVGAWSFQTGDDGTFCTGGATCLAMGWDDVLGTFDAMGGTAGHPIWVTHLTTAETTFLDETWPSPALSARIQRHRERGLRCPRDRERARQHGCGRRARVLLVRRRQLDGWLRNLRRRRRPEGPLARGRAAARRPCRGRHRPPGSGSDRSRDLRRRIRDGRSRSSSWRRTRTARTSHSRSRSKAHPVRRPSHPHARSRATSLATRRKGSAIRSGRTTSPSTSSLPTERLRSRSISCL